MDGHKKETLFVAPEIVDEHDIEEGYKRISPWDKIIRDYSWWEMAKHDNCPLEPRRKTTFLVLIGPTKGLPPLPNKIFCPLCKQEAEETGLIRFPTHPAHFIQKAPDIMFSAPWDICGHRCYDGSFFLVLNRSIDLDAETYGKIERWCPLCAEEASVFTTSSIDRMIFIMNPAQGEN